MKLYKHFKTGRIMSSDEWEAEAKKIKELGGHVLDMQDRISMGILELYAMPYGLPYPGYRRKESQGFI